jgi:hypothetical protein
MAEAIVSTPVDIARESIRRLATIDVSDRSPSTVNPSAINPLIEDSPIDTMANISDVLAFLSDAVEDFADFEAKLEGSGSGLSRILNVCRAALDFQRKQEGGAA